MPTDRLAWFRQVRFGLFVHWGVYSLQRNGEWVMNADGISPADYRELAREFRAEALDVDAWARTAVEAGAKYMVLTTKHHDGFCLWDTATTDFNAVQTGPRRDVVREFVDACRRHGLRVGLYWSWVDWNYPDWAARYVWTDLNEWRQPLPGDAHERMVGYLHAQVRELMTQYGKIDIFWFDGGFLTANQAVLRTSHADGTPALFLSPDAHGGRILGWKRFEDSVEWTFQVDRGGRFRPAFEFNHPESLNCYGRRLEMTVSGQTLRASVPMSGWHHRYDTYRMAGGFTLEPGLHTLTLKPYVLDPGILMNLRAVILYAEADRLRDPPDARDERLQRIPAPTGRHAKAQGLPWVKDTSMPEP